MSVWSPSSPLRPTHYYLPSSWGSERTIGHSQTHQHRIRDRRHFGSTLTPECWSEKNQNGCHLLLLAQNEGQFLHLSQSQVWQKPATEMHPTCFMFFAEPLYPFQFSQTHQPQREGEKMVEVYLLYFLIFALWCKMCRKCLCFCHLKHWRVCICIVSLESLCLIILLSAMHTVSQKSVDIGLRICL